MFYPGLKKREIHKNGFSYNNFLLDNYFAITRCRLVIRALYRFVIFEADTT